MRINFTEGSIGVAGISVSTEKQMGLMIKQRWHFAIKLKRFKNVEKLLKYYIYKLVQIFQIA